MTAFAGRGWGELEGFPGETAGVRIALLHLDSLSFILGRSGIFVNKEFKFFTRTLNFLTVQSS